jgi:ribosome-associated toxin RatA of RatAB toxin-antitoxin module
MASTYFARFTAALAAVSLMAAPLAAHAEDSEATRLAQSRKSERYNIASAGSSIRIHVQAPLATARSVATDYGHYSQFPRFQKSRVVAKKDGKTDVYLQLGILHGAATVWALVRFEPPVKEGNGERIEGRMVEGNVDDLRATWHLTPADDGGTVVKCELLVEPKLHLPGSVVTPELEYAADQAATSVRDRSEVKAKKQAPATARGE